MKSATKNTATIKTVTNNTATIIMGALKVRVLVDY